MKKFDAPWSRTLIILSWLITLLCVGISAVIVWKSGELWSWAAVLPVFILVCAAPFAIRGYSVDADAILVHRLFWATRLPLAGLQSAQYQPNAMHSSIRLFGNGGLFSFTGLFRNKALGNYRAFATDLHRTVVLKFAVRTIVISPEQPEAFVQEVSDASVA